MRSCCSYVLPAVRLRVALHRWPRTERLGIRFISTAMNVRRTVIVNQAKSAVTVSAWK